MKARSLIIAIFILLIDQIVKISIDSFLRISELITVIPNFFYITKVYNDGAAWSIFDGSVDFLIIVSFVAFIILISYQKLFQKNFRNIVAFALIYGGLFGNLVDRIIYGYVIDYLKILFKDFSFPVFNLADMAIVSGFILLIIAVLRGEDKNESSSRKK